MAEEIGRESFKLTYASLAEARTMSGFGSFWARIPSLALGVRRVKGSFM